MTAERQEIDRPVALKVRPDGIPGELKSLPNWAVWSYQYNRDLEKWDKPPHFGASSTDSKTWSTFDDAYKLYLQLDADGLYIAHSKDRPMTGGDFDDCINDGGIRPDVEKRVQKLNTYTELSPSGNGLRTINWGSKPGNKCRTTIDGAEYELYDHGRWLSITGHHVAGYPDTINDDPGAVTVVYKEVFGDNGDKPHSVKRRLTNETGCSSDDVITKASAAKNGDKFKRLFFDGDISEYDGDDSAADLALCGLLTFWCGDDREQIDRLFQQSQLMRPKWYRPTGATTYGEMTIATAIDGCGEVYQGQRDGSEDLQRDSEKKPLSELKFDRNVQHSLCLISKDRAGNEHIRPVPGQIAKYLKDHYFDFITFRDNEQVYYYNRESGLYIRGGVSMIKEASEIIIGDPLSTHTLQQIIAHIQRQTYVDREKVDAIDLDHVAVGNGVLNTRTRELVPFSPDQVYLSKLHCTHDPSAPTNEIEAYMKSTFHEDDIPWLQEYYGWHLEPSMQYKKEAMLLGPGDNGKTVFENCIMVVLGPENVASVSIQDMSDDPYASAELYQKTANIYDDLPAMRVRDTGQFKILNGDGRARAQEKYQKAFYFWNRAKGTNSANKLPGTRDLSPAFFNRWMIAKMPYTYVDPTDLAGNPVRLGPNERPKVFGIVERMTTPAMLSSWLNWMLDGLDRLRTNNRFSSSKTQDEIRDIWLMQTDPISMFVKECLEKAKGTIVEKQAVYKRYTTWCEENDVTAEKDGEFAKRLPTLISTSSIRPRSPGKRPNCWEDIRLIGDVDSDDNQNTQSQLSSADETQPATGFGQGGQGYDGTTIAVREQVHNIKKVVGNTPDHPDQTATRASFESCPYSDDDFLRKFRSEVGACKISDTANRCGLTRKTAPAHICKELADEHHIHLDDIIECWERVARNDSVIEQYLDEIFGGPGLTC